MNEMNISGAENYFSSNSYRTGEGIILNITTEQEKNLANYLGGLPHGVWYPQGGYDLLARNCGQIVTAWIKNTLKTEIKAIKPSGVKDGIVQSGLGIKTEWHPPVGTGSFLDDLFKLMQPKLPYQRSNKKKDPDKKPSEEGTKPAETEKPAEPDKPAEDKPAEDKPAEDKPAEDKPAEDKPAEDKPTEDKPAEDKPAEDKPAEDKPAEDKPAEEDPCTGTDACLKVIIPGSTYPSDPDSVMDRFQILFANNILRKKLKQGGGGQPPVFKNSTGPNGVIMFYRNPYYVNKDPMKTFIIEGHSGKGFMFVRNPFAPKNGVLWSNTYEMWKYRGIIQPEVDPWE